MKKEIISLEIEIRHRRAGEDFRFNDTMLQAVLSGLNVLYEEIFIWSLSNHLAIWAVGGSSELLTRAFLHHRQHYKKIKIETGPKAERLLYDIVEGNTWIDHSSLEKLQSLEQGFALSCGQDSLGANLRPLFADGLGILKADSLVAGAKNSWHKWDGSSISNDVQVVAIKSPDLFYRFCIN